MSATALGDLSRLCIHTMTLKPLPTQTCIQKMADAGCGGITVWRDRLSATDIRKLGNDIRSAGLEVVSVCRGGFFPAIDMQNRKSAIADNKKAIDEAAELGAPLLVLVCGAVPGQSLETSREQIRNGMAECLPYAEQKGVTLAIEPLHPMYASDRSAINTLAQANEMAEYFNSPFVGVAVDVYHVWWDPDLQTQISRCGANGNLSAFHICDWKVPTKDMLNDRGLMGEGCIDIKTIRGWVEETGFSGFIEVEIFSTAHWEEDQNIFFKKIIQGYLEHS